MVFLALVILLAAGPALATPDFALDSLSQPDTDCLNPHLASSDDGLTMISYTAIGTVTMSFIVTQLLPTHPQTGVPWPDPVTITAGSTSRLCWSRDGFTLAIPSGSMILLYQSDLQGNWDLAQPEMLAAGGEVMSLDLWGTPSDAAGPAVFLTWHAAGNPPEPEGSIYYAARGSWGWSSPEEVAQINSPESFPQLTWSIGPAGPFPTIFYLDGALDQPTMWQTTKDLQQGWTQPQVVPGDGVSTPTPFGGQFDVVSPWDLNRHILGMGIQPTCPCNHVWHQYLTPNAGWHPAEHITPDYGYFDWPHSPCLDFSSDGTVHGFWSQTTYSFFLDPYARTLEYWTFDGSGWQRVGDFLDGQPGPALGDRVALDVSPLDQPVLAWTRRDTVDGVPFPEQVWLARPLAPSAAEDEPMPEPGDQLRAWPNPFNPVVHLEVATAQQGNLKVEIYDSRGRRVAVLLDEIRPAGRYQVTWHGTDFTGRNVASGTYLAQLSTPDGQTRTKLSLVR